MGQMSQFVRFADLVPTALLQTSPTLYDRIISRIENNPVIAILILIGTIVGALAAFTGALQRLSNAIPRNRAQAARAEIGRLGLRFDAEDFVKSAERDDLHAVKAFLTAGMDPNVKDRHGWTALTSAAKNGSNEIISTLLKSKADLEKSSWEGTALRSAVLGKHKDTLRLLVKESPSREAMESAFTTAAWCSDIDAMRLLLKSGVAIGSVGTEALTLAAQGFTKEAGVTNETVYDTVRFLLALEVDPNATDREGYTALYWAGRVGRTSAVEALLDAGADINATCSDGDTALIVSIRQCEWQIAEILLGRGANANPAGARGETALIVAAKELPGSLLILRPLLTNGADPNAADVEGRTALMYAAKSDETEMTLTLLEQDASVNSRDTSGQTALHCAAQYGSANNCSILLDKGADVDCKDSEGMTPLMYAAQRSRPKLLRLLLSRGADVHEKNIRGKSVLQLIQECRNSEKRDEMLHVLRAA